MYQSPEKKKVTNRYCARHNWHYHKYCLWCSVEDETQFKIHLVNVEPPSKQLEYEMEDQDGG